jgi:hypothetical protein
MSGRPSSREWALGGRLGSPGGRPAVSGRVGPPAALRGCLGSPRRRGVTRADRAVFVPAGPSEERAG